MSTQSVIEDIAAERKRQIEVEGWSLERDDRYVGRDLAWAASAYAFKAALGDELSEVDLPPEFWPWDVKWWKPGSTRRMLIKAAALIVAEIERLDRAHG